MFPEVLTNLMLVALFAVPILIGILSLFFKRWRGRLIHYSVLSLAGLLTVTYLTVTVSSTPTEAHTQKGDDIAHTIDDGGMRRPRCMIPGIVRNRRSSGDIKVKGDMVGYRNMPEFTIGPGENSDTHTPLCDVDHFTVPDKSFTYKSRTYNAGQWSSYFGWGKIACYDGDPVDCRKTYG